MMTIFIKTCHFHTYHLIVHPSIKMFVLFFTFCSIFETTTADVTTEDVQFLNELPLDKLLRLKTSLQDLVTTELVNVTTVSTTPPYLESFGAQAMAMNGAPIRRGDYEEGSHKTDHYSTKISNIFSMSVTTLAFLAFGGYLLCLIVQAVKAKQMYNFNTPTTVPVPQPTFLVSAGIKKRPQPQFASYGRRRRDNREVKSLRQVDLPPEQLFAALVQFCEGYAKWSDRYGDGNAY